MIVEPTRLSPRVLLTGSRRWTDWEAVNDVLQEYPERTVFIHGGARGLDSMAEQIASALGFATDVYEANWMKGTSAGPTRNQEMLDKGKPTECVAFPLPDSKGTLDMIRRVWLARLPLRIVDGAPSPAEVREEDIQAWVKKHVHWPQENEENSDLREVIGHEFSARYGRQPFPAEVAQILAEMNGSDSRFHLLPYQEALLRLLPFGARLRSL